MELAGDKQVDSCGSVADDYWLSEMGCESWAAVVDFPVSSN